MPKNKIVNIIGKSKARGEPKNGKLSNFLQKIGAYVIWFMIVVLAVSVARNMAKVKEVGKVVSNEQAKVDKIKAENAALEAQIQETQSQAFIEKEVRNKLGLAKEGETIVVLPDEETLRELAPHIYEETNTLPDPNWKKWLKLFL